MKFVDEFRDPVKAKSLIAEINDLVDQIIWRHPLAKLLLNSPAVQILKWAQSEFPGIHPGGVTDSVPLMRPPQHKSEIRIALQGDM